MTSRKSGSFCSRKTAQLLHCLLFLVLAAANGFSPCPNCGNFSVPYPLSTADTCGHPLYRISCTPHLGLQFNAASGFNYTIKHIEPASRTVLVDTAGFRGNSCITQDSSESSADLALNSSLPFFLMPNNTIFLLNATHSLMSLFDCSATSPCTKALNVLPQVSCRSVRCCAILSVGSSTGKTYSFPIYGFASAYASVVNLNNNTEATSWTYGLQIGWDIPQEPPCTSQAECGSNSLCSSITNQRGMFCICNRGHNWDPVTGTCREAPYCKVESRSIRCNKTKYVLGLTLGSVGILALSALVIIHGCKKHKAAQRAQQRLIKEREAILGTKSGGKYARLFSSKEMKRATNNFAKNKLLGCGGFGEVYKGVLEDGTEVAVKSAKLGNIKGTDQVLNEVRVLSQVNHRSLVQLLGCCVERALPLMVYEYVPNGNLYDHIHGLQGAVLDWRTRLHIALQAAEGLAYLHFAVYPPIYHRDVKTSNILLDKSLNARVADFGLSRLAEADLTHVTTCAQGTLGYLDPQYFRTFQLTDRSDVYSFGVVLLELVTSMKALEFGRLEDDVSLAVMVQNRAEQGELDDVLDPKLTMGASKGVVESMKTVVALALDCFKESVRSRPSMQEVVDTLRWCVAMLERDSENDEVDRDSKYGSINSIESLVWYG